MTHELLYLYWSWTFHVFPLITGCLWPQCRELVWTGPARRKRKVSHLQWGGQPNRTEKVGVRGGAEKVGVQGGVEVVGVGSRGWALVLQAGVLDSLFRIQTLKKILYGAKKTKAVIILLRTRK